MGLLNILIKLVDRLAKQQERGMTVAAWDNGNPDLLTGAGFGIRIRKEDRDRYFDTAHPEITIHLSNGPTIKASLTPSFWNNCTEIRHKEIGRWILENSALGHYKLIGLPPKFRLKPISNIEFELSKLEEASGRKE